MEQGEERMHPLLARLPFIRRPFYQRDKARLERDALLVAQNALLAERDALKLELRNAGGDTQTSYSCGAASTHIATSQSRICIFCGAEVEAWIPYRIRESDRSGFVKKLQTVGSNVERFECPHCSSIDRERHLRLFLDRLNIMECARGGSILHMSAEYRLRGYVESCEPRRYVRGDLLPQADGVQQIDLQSIPFPDETFDLLICNHMLEHVADAALALGEMHRVLKRGGRAICQTPYAPRLTQTFEDPLLQSPDDRLFFYGQEDHVRLFGSDIERYFAAAGFVGRLVPHAEILPDVDPEQFGINEREPFFDFVRT
jgi:SAM-dependent methyltransferase